MPCVLHFIQILGVELDGLWAFLLFRMQWFKYVCVCVCVCVCFQCLCLDIADVVEASGKCCLVYDNLPSLLTIS
jgi:hypothetical protein